MLLGGLMLRNMTLIKGVPGFTPQNTSAAGLAIKQAYVIGF